MRVLITGARSPAALDLARDMDAAGIEVHMADSSTAWISRMSGSVDAFHRISPPVQDPEGFRRDVVALVKKLRPHLVVPTCEEVFHLAAALEEGHAVGALFAPDMATLDQLHAKDRFNALAARLGLDVPSSMVFYGPIDTAVLDLPRTVLKACYSRFGAGTLMRPTSGQARAVKPAPRSPWVAQHLVEGVEHSSYAVCMEGRVTAFASYRSTMRLDGGAGYAFVPASDDVSQRMLDATVRLAGHLGMTGQLSLDAIDDGSRSWLIECNPRATSGVHLICGDGRLARAMTGDRGMAICNPGHRHNLPMMMTHGLMVGGSRPNATSRDVIGARGDRLPVLGAVLDTAAFAMRSARHRISITAATTMDIEWNGGRA